MSAPPPRVIAGRYRLERPLGEGGMGEVHAAFDLRLERSVALKLLAVDRVGSGVAQRRMLREARVAASLDHPSIAHVYDVGVDEEGVAYIAMELIAGRTLAAARGESPRQVLTWIAQVARALAAAHRADLVHRDVKPANIMVREDGRVVLLDFGVAKSVAPLDDEPLTRDGAVIGTPQFLSPEQARGKPLDGRSDMFSLAVTAFECLTGRVPWEGETAPAVMAALITEEPRPLSELAPELPDQLEAVLLRALRKDPDERYPDCDAFADALEEVTRGGWAHAETPPALLATIDTAPTLDAPSMSEPAPAARDGEPSVRRSPRRGDEEADARPSDALPAQPPAPSAPIGAPAPRRWRLYALAAAALGAAIGGAAWMSVRPPELASTALDPVTHVDCPPLATEPGADPWLGAAAATLICERVGVLLGAPDRVRYPAALIGLSRTPVDDLPEDPWSRLDVHERARRAASDGPGAWIDGEVHEDNGEIIVTARLVVDGDAGASVRAEGAIHRAVADAVAGLEAQGALRRVDAPDPEWARWSGVGDVALALDLLDARVDRPDVSEVCGRIVASSALTRWRRDALGQANAACAPDEPPTLDESSPEALAGSVHGAEVPRERLRDIAGALRRARDDDPSRYARAYLATAESHVWRQLDEPSRAHAAAIEALDAAPQLRPALDALYWAAITPRDQSDALRHLTAWRPDQYWGLRAAGLPPEDADDALRYARRAYVVDASVASASVDLALVLLRRGHLAEARGVATRLTRLRRQVAAEQVLAGTELGEANVALATSRLAQLLDELERFGDYNQQDLLLAYFAAEIVALTGETALADRFAERFVLGEAPRLGRWSATLRAATVLCAHARSELAAACLDRLDELARTGQLGVSTAGSLALLAAARASLAGRTDEAVAAARRLADERSQWDVAGFALVVSPILDAGGEGELADRLDRRAIAIGGFLAGVGMADVRAARRAQRAGRDDEARQLAASVVEALGAADVGLAVVDEMRALSAR